MCKPLKDKIVFAQYTHGLYVDEYPDSWKNAGIKINEWIGIELVSKADVKSAVDFYKKYRDDFLLFKRDFPEVVQSLEKDLQGQHLYQGHWERWLFDYCFQDVIEKNKDVIE